MGEEKKVSVIVPVYNIKDYIESSIESLITQTYRNLEIIVVDDGSSDGTFDIINRAAEKDVRIIPIHQKNGGVSDARNHGLSVASGEFVYFLDGDDIAESDAVEKLVNAMEQSGADLVGCQYSRWGEDGNRLEDYSFKSFNVELKTGEDRVRFITEELLQYHIGFEVWNKLFRAEIIKRGHLMFDIRSRMGEDLSFNMKYILNVKRIYTIPDRCVRYQIRQGSAMSETGALSRRITDDSLVLADVWDYIDRNGENSILDSFGTLFVKVMEHAFSKCTAKEVSEAVKEIRDKTFITKKYREIRLSFINAKKLFSNYKVMHRLTFHIYVRKCIGAGRFWDRPKLLAYGIYLKLRRQGRLEDWRLT